MLNQDIRAQDIWRTLARTWSVLVIVYWLIAVIARVPFEPFSAVGTEGALFNFFILSAAFSIAIAWRWEWQGAILLLITSISLGIFAFTTAHHSTLFAMVILAAPFLLSTSLFLLSDWCKRVDEEEAQLIVNGL